MSHSAEIRVNNVMLADSFIDTDFEKVGTSGAESSKTEEEWELTSA
jgi:hypothetical protein